MAPLSVARFALDGRDRVGLTDGAAVWDLSDEFTSLPALLERATSRPEWLEDDGRRVGSLSLDEVSLLAPVEPISRIFCVALNYRNHVLEVGQKIPERPLIFMKPSTAIIATGDAIQGHPSSAFLDYEGEIAVVVGKRASRVAGEEALAYVSGYTLLNDTTARDFIYANPAERRMPDWTSAKGLDRSTPLGPWITPAGSIPDPLAIQFKVFLNGEQVQDADPSDMVFGIPELIAFLSDRVTLLPGDIIATGTPSGVGRMRNRPLRSGDVVEVRSEQLGTLQNMVA